MLTDRNQCQEPEDQMSWHNVDNQLLACMVHLFCASKHHIFPPAANHVKCVGGTYR
jgi:hypothetical protein